MTSPRIRLAGCVFTSEDKKVLLIHRNKSGKIQWETPGGKVEPNELEEVAAVREIEEELGIQVSLLRKIGEGDFSEADKKLHYVWYAGKLNQNQDILLEDGFDEFGWFPLSEVNQLASPLSPGTQKLFELHQAGKFDIFG